ncbi:MAG: hypothetical protein JWO03_942 [Bacteroidetes bacterium]|nr:hypothetical protein [Bacteroidota bacterium]
MKHSHLTDELAKMEKKRNDLFEKLSAYDIEVLTKKPVAEAWSVIQVIEHMLTVELAALSYVKKKSQDKAAAQKTGFKEWMRSMLLNRFLKSSKKKFPAPPSVLPIVKYASLNEMREQWNAIRHDIQETILAMPADLLGHNWFKHPSVGKLNLKQMITFMESHYDRHEKQVWRTLKEVS